MAIPITKKIKLDLSKIPRNSREDAKEEIAEYLLDTVLDHVSRIKSPVSGGAYKPTLSKDYKKIKAKISGSTKPNMELYGDMLDDLDARFEGSTLSFGIHGDASEESMLKAENHNKFTARARKTKLPERSFIPRKDQDFKKSIMSDIKDIIESYADQDQ